MRSTTMKCAAFAGVLAVMTLAVACSPEQREEITAERDAAFVDRQWDDGVYQAEKGFEQLDAFDRNLAADPDSALRHLKKSAEHFDKARTHFAKAEVGREKQGAVGRAIYFKSESRQWMLSRPGADQPAGNPNLPATDKRFVNYAASLRSRLWRGDTPTADSLTCPSLGAPAALRAGETAMAAEGPLDFFDVGLRDEPAPGDDGAKVIAELTAVEGIADIARVDV